MKAERNQRPTAAFLAIVWAMTSLATWGLLCLAAVTFEYPLLKAGLIPAEVLLSLAVIPVAIVAIGVQVILYVASIGLVNDGVRDVRMFLLIGTPVVTSLLLAVIIILSGGLEAFVPRL